MPEELDPRDERAYLAYKQAQDAYAAEAAATPQPEKPGLWRKLAAIGAGAFGGSQYDKGGMQWGQNLGKEILEGPYQRRMNEHLKQLAAKRMGLDVAQEGIGVMGNISARKAQAAVAAQVAADRKETNEAKLREQSQYARQKKVAAIQQNTKNNFKIFNSRDEALKYQASDPTTKYWDIDEDTVDVPGEGRRAYLMEGGRAQQARNAIDISSTVSMYNQIAPKVGMQPIDNPGRVSKEEATFKLGEAKELYKMKYQADQTNLGYARIASMASQGGGNEEAKDELRKHKETAAITKQFASLKSSKENQYLDKISYARAQGNEVLAKQLEKQRGLELLELYNNSHRQIANIWGNPQFKQGRFNEKGELVDEMVGGSGAPTAVAAPKPAANQIEDWVRDANGKLVPARKAGQ